MNKAQYKLAVLKKLNVMAGMNACNSVEDNEAQLRNSIVDNIVSKEKLDQIIDLAGLEVLVDQKRLELR